MKRRWIILLFVVLAVIAAIFLVWPHGSSRRAVEAYKQELRARGEKLTIAELAPQKPANAAMAARVLSNSMGYGLTHWSDLAPFMRPVKPGAAQVGFTNITPERMQNYQRNIQVVSQLRTDLQHNILEFDLDYSKWYEMSVLHLGVLMDLTALAAGTAMQGLYSRDFDQAWLDLMTAVDLVRLHLNEPILFSGLRRAMDARDALAVVWEAMQGHEWTDAQLQELQTAWQDMDLFKTSEPSLALQRALLLDMMARVRVFTNKKELMGVGPVLTSPRFRAAGTRGSTGKLMAWFRDRYENQFRFGMWKSSWSYDEELCALQSLSAALESARRAKATGAFLPAYADFQRKTNEIAKLHPDAARQYVFNSSTGAPYGDYLLRLARMETCRRLVVAVIALQRFKLKHGAYPVSLSELMPEYVKEIPRDFMDGQPLRYRLNPDGSFLLYSVGEDGLDGGGDVSPRMTQSPTANDYEVGRDVIWPLMPGPEGAKVFENGRDIVWPRAATVKEIEEFERRAQSTNGPTAR